MRKKQPRRGIRTLRKPRRHLMPDGVSDEEEDETEIDGAGIDSGGTKQTDDAAQ